ncbi:hypothetical protein JCGZ_25428 [Jatropha curcas]|uniref:Aminotransferase-like plant mobile domain-containing protein n=1 Tax=Jatropha curcas TaxID=180498 RepID=A0A067JPP7_JATCU|nr:hypothetical protein JCGZ_25428 [Jatropha curcas]
MRGFQTELRHTGRSCVTQLFLREQLRDAAVLSEQLRDATVDLGKACAGGSSTDALAFWDLLDPPMRAQVIAAGFSNYAAGLHRTQPRFPPAMRYALMERWNDYTHTFIFGFGEMTLTPADYTTITGLRFDGPVAPLDARYSGGSAGPHAARCDHSDPIHRAGVWAYKYRIYPGGPSGDTPADSRWIARYFAHCHHTFSSSEDPHYWRCFLNDRALSDLLLTPWEGEAWRTYPARGVAKLYTRSRLLLRGYWLDWYFLGERVYELQVPTAQRRVPHAPPRHMCLLEGMTREDLEEEYEGSPANASLSAGDYAAYFSTRLQARLPVERKKHRIAAYYRAEAEVEAEATALAGLAGAVLGDVPFPPGMEVALDPALGLRSAIIIPADLRQAPPPLQLDPEHATPLRDTRSCAGGLGSPGLSLPGSILSVMRGTWRSGDCGGTRLGRRHQSRQSSAVTRLQLEVDRLRMRLEVEGIPLDFFEDEEDDDGSSSGDAQPSPPPQAAAGPSRRRR